MLIHSGCINLIKTLVQMSSLNISFGINPDSKATYIQKKSSCSLSSYRSQQHQYGWIPAHHHHHPSCRQLTQTLTWKDSSSRTFDIKNANGGLYVAGVQHDLYCFIQMCSTDGFPWNSSTAILVLPHHGAYLEHSMMTSYPGKPWHLHWSHI